MANTAVIIFIGCDKTGKSTLMKEVLKRTNRHICVDRFTPCQFVYGMLHCKLDTPNLYKLRELEEYLNSSPIPVFFVYVEASTDDIIHRFKIHNETDIFTSQIDLVKNKYKEYLKETPIKVLKVNTSENNITDCTDKILKFAERL